MGLAAMAIIALAILALAPFVASPYADRMEHNGIAPRTVLAPAAWNDSALTIANLGHATPLIDYFGTRLISDPSLFARVGLSIDSILTIGPKRVVPPPLAPSSLARWT